MTLTAGVRIDGGASAPHWDAIVVGAGLGGLCAAAFLATNGQRVLVLEQHPVVGGSCQVVRRHDSAGGRHEFEVGMHRVGECQPGGRMRTLLGALGVDDRITWDQLDPHDFAAITLPDVQMRLPVGWDAYEQRLVETFPGEADALRRCVGVLRAVAIGTQASGPRGALGAVRRLAGDRTTLRWRSRPLAALLDACGLGPNARAVVAGGGGDYAAPPSRVTVGVHAGLLDHHLVSGAWRPRGGGQVLPARLLQVIRAHGGELRTEVRVDRILMEGGRAVGVTMVDGEELRADAVVSNSDPKRTYLGLVGREHLSSRLLRRAETMVPALPYFTVHLALDADLHGRLPHATGWILPHADLEAFYDATYAGRTDGPVPVRMTASPGRSTLELVTVAPSHPWAWGLRAGGPSSGERYSDEPAYLAAKDQLLEAVLDTVELVVPDLRRHVVHREAATPVTQERYTLAWSGTSLGPERTRGQVGPVRPDATTPVPGLFLTGAGTTYVPGIVSTVESGVAAAGAVLGRDLHAELAQGRTYGDPTLLPADGPDWDPLAVSTPGPSTRSEPRRHE